MALNPVSMKGSCHRDDPELATCLKRTMMAWRPFLAEGLPNYGVPKLQPLFIKEMFTDVPVGPNKGVFMSANNITVTGCTDYVVKHVDISVTDRTLTYETHFPKISIDGLYRTYGSYYIPLCGSGKVTANYLRCVAKVSLRWELVTRNNIEYMNVTHCDGKIEVGAASDIFMENFIYSDPGLAGFVNVMINLLVTNSNSFWNLVSHDVIEATEKKLAPMMMEVLNSVCRLVPYNNILLDL